MSKRKPNKAKRYDVTIVEVLVHRARIVADGICEANELARQQWEELGAEAFTTETLGSTDLIIADEVTP